MTFSESTQKRVQFFKEKFRALGYQDGHYILACHSAFPIVLTSDLLYQIWANFKNYSAYLTIDTPRSIDIIAVSDLLMSNLVAPTGKNFFEMDQEIRGYLLHQLESDLRFGAERLKALAQFLYQYTDATQSDPFLEDAQYWTALATLAPEMAAGKIKEALDQSIKSKNETEILRLRELLEAYNYQDNRFSGLLEVTKGIKAAIFGYDKSIVQNQFDKGNMLAVGDDKKPGGKVLEIPLWEELEGKIRIYNSAEERAREKALRRIEEAKAPTNTRLDLSSLGLKELPEQLFELTHLEELNLDNNQLSKFPLKISRLRSLKKLFASKNPINFIPASITHNIKSLELLQIDDAQIEILPSPLLRHKNLHGLSLANNKIQFLPQEITKMKNLKSLNLKGNPVLNIPSNYLQSTGQEIRDYFDNLPKFDRDIPVMLAVFAGETIYGDLKLKEEEEAIRNQFQKYITNNQFYLEILVDPSTVELFETFKKYQKHLVVFHFGGFISRKGELALFNEKKEFIRIQPELINRFFAFLHELKLIVLNGNNSLLLSKDNFGNISPGLIVTNNEISNKDAIAFTDYFYQKLAERKPLNDSFEETKVHLYENNEYKTAFNPVLKGIMDQLETGFKWELLPKVPSDLKPIQKSLKNQISRFNVNGFFREWNQHVPAEYKKGTIKELKKQNRQFSSRAHSSPDVDQDTQSKISNGLIQLVDDLTVEDTRAYHIRNWQLFEDYDIKQIISTSLLKLPVDVNGEEDLKNQFFKFYNSNPSKFLDIQDGASSSYQLKLEPDALSIIRNDYSQQLIHGIRGFGREEVKYVIEVLEQIEKWERISNLQNENSGLDSSKIEIQFIDIKTKQSYDTDSVINLEYKEEKIPFSILVSNRTGRDLYFNLLYLSSRFRIMRVGEVLQIKDSDLITHDLLRENLLIANDEQASSTDIFQVIISTNPIDTEQFTETGIEPNMVSLERTKGIGQRDLSFDLEDEDLEEITTKDWLTKKLTIKLVREEEKIWKVARNKDNEEDYLEYLELFPDGKYQQEAHERMEKKQKEELERLESLKKSNDKLLDDIEDIQKGKPSGSKEDSKTPGTGQNLNKLKERLRRDIGEGKTEKVLKELMNLEFHNDFQNSIILLSGQYNGLKRDKISGLISSSDESRRLSRINYSLLSIIDDL